MKIVSDASHADCRCLGRAIESLVWETIADIADTRIGDLEPGALMLTLPKYGADHPTTSPAPQPAESGHFIHPSERTPKKPDRELTVDGMALPDRVNPYGSPP